jgi:hypothetical protein
LVDRRTGEYHRETMSTDDDPDAPDPLVSPRASEEPVAPGTDVAASEPEGDAAAPAQPSETQPSATFREEPPRHAASSNMLPQRERRRSVFERLIVRLVATCGIVGIGVAIAAIMVSSKSQGWIVGLVVSIVTVVLAGLLWSSRML